jgi:hypothetical protein
MFKKNWGKYLVAYLLWFIAMALGVLFLLIGRNSILTILALTTDPTSFDALQWARLIDRAFVFIVGVAWVILMVVAEHYFRTGVQIGILWKRAARLIGILISMIFVADFINAMGQGLTNLGATRWIILIGELVLAIGLIVISRRLKGVVRPVINY